MDSHHREMLFMDDLHTEVLVSTNITSGWIINLATVLYTLEILESGLL